jgi:starch synthase
VPIEQVQDGTGTPVDPDKFVGRPRRGLTNAVSDRERARTMGLAGRKRAVEQFSWESIGDKTMAVYQDVLGRS